MELHELQVAHRGPCAPGHRHPIATGLGWIGGVGEQVSATAGGQHHGPGRQPVDAIAVQHLQAAATSRLHPELEGDHAPPLAQSRPSLHLPFEGVHEGAAGAVLGVQHAPVAVGRLQGGAEPVAAQLPVKGHAQIQKALDAAGGFMHQQGHRLGVAEPRAGSDCVLVVAGEAIFR